MPELRDLEVGRAAPTAIRSHFLATLGTGCMVDAAVVTGAAQLCNMEPSRPRVAALSGKAFDTWGRGQVEDLGEYMPPEMLSNGRLADRVSTVLLPLHQGDRRAGHWLLARADRALAGWEVGIFDPSVGDYCSVQAGGAGGSEGPALMPAARQLLASLTGLPVLAFVAHDADSSPGRLPAVPRGFRQPGSDQVSCGVYCMMLMAFWTAEAAQLPLDLGAPALHMIQDRARSWLALSLASNRLLL